MTDNAECVERMQRWLYARQFRPENCAVVHAPRLDHFAGLGSSIMSSARLMLRALEGGAVYRPAGEWLWADPNASACQLGLRSIDCFTLPLSVCNASQEHRHTFTDDSFDYSIAGAATPTSVCGLARQYRKPSLWVIGNLIRFHLRLPAPLLEVIHGRVLTALHGRPEARPSLQYGAVLYRRGDRLPARASKRRLLSSQLRTPTSLSAGIHVRAGRPDLGRRALDVAEYLAAVDGKSRASVEAGGPPVAHVYLCSNAPETNLAAVDHLYGRFPHNYTYEVLPHASFGNLEAEHILRGSTTRARWYRWLTTVQGKRLPAARDVFLEYITDVEALTRSDIFIGSHSNMYALVAALRMTFFPEKPPQHTCYLDSHRRPAPLVCEGTAAARHFWLSSFGVAMNLTGGSPFLH
eukprot:EG_transcript_13060